MCTSALAASNASFFLFSNRPHVFRNRPSNFLINTPFPFLTPHNLKLPTPRFSDPIAGYISWVDPKIDDFGGWDLSHSPVPIKGTGFPRLLIAGVGTSITLIVAVATYFSFSKNGFRLSFRRSLPLVVEEAESRVTDSDATDEENVASESVEEELSHVVSEPAASEILKPRIISVHVDPSQQEAVSVLKKLKIIDEDVRADEICSRREYARWLIRTSSLLERNPKHKITTAVTLSGSVSAAFEDVTFGDVDFDSIQALAEAGVVSSKLSIKFNLGDVGMKFCPESFISRRDLIDWRAQLEYDFSLTANQEMLKTKLNLLDVREISSDNWPGLLMDMLAGDKSLLRRVFGQIRRLQPSIPSTVAQAAIALSSGRMTEAIDLELQRIQVEESAKQAAKEEIKIELLDRGEIQRNWNEKMDEVKALALEMQQLYIDAHEDLEQEKSVQEVALNGYLKEKAAMDCQKQLLNCLKEEVNEMSEKLVSERDEQIADEESAQILSRDLQTKREGILDAKSLLEAEIEALRILRTWIEDEARKCQARSKVLEAVGQRWKWNGEH